MILEFLNLCFAVTATPSEIRTIALNLPGNDDDDIGLSEEMIIALSEDNELNCLLNATITKISKLTNGSSSEAVFRIETSDRGTYIIKSTRAPFAGDSWRRAFHAQRGKSAEREIVPPQTAMNNFIKLSENSELINWNTIQKFENSTRLLVSLPIELLKIQISGKELHLEIFEAAPGKSLAECIKGSNKAHCAELFKNFGRILALFHKTTGLIHGDLNITNIFVSPNGSTFTLIDGNSMHRNPESPSNHDVEKFLLSLNNATVRRPSLGIEPLIEMNEANDLIAAFEEGYYGKQKEDFSDSDDSRSSSTAGHSSEDERRSRSNSISSSDEAGDLRQALNEINNPAPPPQTLGQSIY